MKFENIQTKNNKQAGDGFKTIREMKLTRKQKADRNRKKLQKEYQRGNVDGSAWALKNCKDHHQRIYNYLVDQLAKLESAEDILFLAGKDSEFKEMRVAKNILSALIKKCYEGYDMGYYLNVTKHESRMPKHTGSYGFCSSGTTHL